MYKNILLASETKEGRNHTSQMQNKNLKRGGKTIHKIYKLLATDGPAHLLSYTGMSASRPPPSQFSQYAAWFIYIFQIFYTIYNQKLRYTKIDKNGLIIYFHGGSIRMQTQRHQLIQMFSIPILNIRHRIPWSKLHLVGVSWFPTWFGKGGRQASQSGKLDQPKLRKSFKKKPETQA